MDLSVITVTWNSAEQIGRQLRSVKDGCQAINYEQIVVDNGSSDQTVELVRAEFPEVKLVVNEKNAGFAAANNQGAGEASGRWLLFLNPDMRVSPGSLDVIVRWMDEHTDVGIVSPKLVDEKGALTESAKPRRFPGLFDQAAVILKLPHLFPRLLNRYLMSDFDPDKEQVVDSVRGSFMLMRREIVERLGFAFDPRYFIWFEDVDICREVKQLGLKVMYTPVITCVDYVGQSFKKRDTLWKQKQFTKSLKEYFKKWEPRWKWHVLCSLRPVGIGLAWLGDMLSKRKV